MTLHNVMVQIKQKNLVEDQKSCWGYTVLVKDLPSEITAEDLIDLGSAIGPVVEVRLFLIKREAHIKFTSVEHGIQFMETLDGQSFKDATGSSFTPIVEPSWDYPFLVLTGLPERTSEVGLISNLQAFAPGALMKRVHSIENGRAVVEFKSQRYAKKLKDKCKTTRLVAEGKVVTVTWEGAPCIYIKGVSGIKDKKEIREAFSFIGEEHILAVAMLEKGIYVYFDYRKKCVEAYSTIQTPLELKKADGSKIECTLSLL